MKKIITTVVLLAFFVGCGGSSAARDNIGAVIDSNTTTADTNTTTPPPVGTPKEVVEMITNEIYFVYEGDEIKKTSSDAKIKIVHNKNEETTAVALIDGSAIINHY